MADFYLSANGDDGTGAADDPALPFLTFTACESAGLGDGDRLFIQGDAFDIGTNNGGFIDITANYGIFGYQGRPTITGTNAVRVLRNSSSLVATDEPVYQDLIIDGEGTVQRPLELSGDSTGPDRILVRNVRAFGGTATNFYIGREAGLIEFENIAMQGDVLLGVSTASTTAGTVGATNINVRGLQCDNLTMLGSGSAICQVQRPAAATFPVVAAFERITGSAESTSAVTFINMEAVDQPVVKNCDLTLSSSAAGESVGIQINGTASYTTNGAVVVDNTLRFNPTAGHGIALGEDSAQFAGTGSIVCNHLTGEYNATATPHGMSLRGGSTGEMLGNVVHTSFACFLISRTTSSKTTGNLAYNGYGPCFYVKGAQGAALEDNLVSNNTGVRPAAALARNVGALSCAPQGAVNTLFAVFEANTIVAEDPVADAARGAYLGEITNASQNCEFRRNVYYVPDTVDISTALLFNDNGVPATLATWNARADVFDDRIIPLPIDDLRQLINYYERLAQPGVMAGASALGVIAPVIRTLN